MQPVQCEARYGESVKVLTHTKEYKIKQTIMKRNVYLMNTTATKTILARRKPPKPRGKGAGASMGSRRGERGVQGQEEEESRSRRKGGGVKKRNGGGWTGEGRLTGEGSWPQSPDPGAQPECRWFVQNWSTKFNAKIKTW